jgi:hypothetical protein
LNIIEKRKGKEKNRQAEKKTDSSQWRRGELEKEKEED